MIDIAVVGLGAVGSVTTLLAAGLAIYLGTFGPIAGRSDRTVDKLAFLLAAAGCSLVIALHVSEPARMTASLAGIFDRTLQTLLLQTDAGPARSIRALGLIVIAWSACSKHPLRKQLGLIGAVIALGSFALMGHTAEHADRWILSPLLQAHVLVAAFWFGALTGFWYSSKREESTAFASKVMQFSGVATWLVPVILIAGLAMTALLLPDLPALTSPYGMMLIAKLLAFAGLIVLAAWNKFRVAPAMAGGRVEAGRTFRRLVAIEWLIVATVVAATAVMTGLFGPE